MGFLSSLVWVVFYSAVLIVVHHLEKGEGWVNAQGLYASHNLCITNEVNYSMELFKDSFSVNETISLKPLERVYECFFTAEKFDVNTVKVTTRNGTKEFDAILQLFQFGVYSIRLGLDTWRNDTEYKVEFSAVKQFTKKGQGLTFKVYRERATFKRNWYALVHINPSQCGKAFFCTNNLKDLHTLKIQAIHWNTHQLNCAGQTTSKRYNTLKNISVCSSTYKVGVNNLHYSLTNFQRLEYVTESHHITMVGPQNDQSVIYPEIEEQFKIIKKIYSLLLLSPEVNLKPFHVIFYVLPNYHKDIPEVFSGSCYFKLENILYNINVERTLRSYLKCLLHQGYMNERESDSWVLRYVPEGLFIKLVNTYRIKGVANDYYKQVLLRDKDDLDSLAKYNKYVGEIPTKRPWRKAAGFFNMLESISPSYGKKTFAAFYSNTKPIETHTKFVNWITEHSHLLQLNKTQFLEMLYTWTAPPGYPIISTEVQVNRTVCVARVYNKGYYFRTVIVPSVLSYNFPADNDTHLLWVNPRVDIRAYSNCHEASMNLYPYLINSKLNMVGRVLYDKTNWEIWAEKLKKRNYRDALSTRQKVTLVMDALYFAQNNQLRWTMSIQFLVVLVRMETDELAWRSYDHLLAYLESLTRYTLMYTMFKRLVSDLVAKYYYFTDTPSGIAQKWSCWAGVVECLWYTEKMANEALVNYKYTPNLTETLCGGMRRLQVDTFRAMVNSLGKPDWREPIFYIDMMMCAEDGAILREMMHHIFFFNSWLFRSSLLRSLLIRMIERGKSGSDAVFDYLDHNPQGMLKQLGVDNLLDVFDALAKYTRNPAWLQRFIKRLYLKKIWNDTYLNRFEVMFEQMKKNKRWYNMHYQQFSMYLVEEYQIQVQEYEP